MASPMGARLVTMTIKPPIIIADKMGNDLSIYPSIEDARQDLEAVDIMNGEYVGYDAEGRLLILDVAREKRPILFGLFRVPIDTVRIRSFEDEPQHEALLRKTLIQYISHFQSVHDLPVDEGTLKLTEVAMGLLKSK